MSVDHTPTITLEHADDRGELYSISLPDNRELMLLHSKKGSLRGGHSHSVPETVMVLTGRMDYHKKHKDVDFTVRLGAGEVSSNAAGQVHMGEFTEDTWLIELKHARKGEWEQHDFEPWRKRVRANAG